MLFFERKRERTWSLTMPTRRVHSPFIDRRASLIYFAAGVPAVGFVHGAADVNSFNEAMVESFMNDVAEDRRRRLAERLAQLFAARYDSFRHHLAGINPENLVYVYFIYQNRCPRRRSVCFVSL